MRASKFCTSVLTLSLVLGGLSACTKEASTTMIGTGGMIATGGARNLGGGPMPAPNTGGMAASTGGMMAGTGGGSGSGGSGTETGSEVATEVRTETATETGGGDTAAAVGYMADIRPIFMVKCAACHTTNMMGGHRIGTNYQDAMKTVMNAGNCGGTTTVGACSNHRIKNGTMPMGKGCAANPTAAGCLTDAEKAKVQAWVDGGLKP